MTAARTFPELLDARLRSDPGRPLVTAYDDTTGERTELSVTTYANWVSKNANLLVDELDLEPGDALLLDLPAHWLVPVFLGAAWVAGVAVTRDPATEHAAVVCGPDRLAQHTGSDVPVVACALRPFAVRFADPLPEGVLDHGVLWPGQSDVFVPMLPASPDTVAWADEAGGVDQGELLRAASGAPEGVRLLTDEHPAAGRGVPAFLRPLAAGGSLVLVRHGAEAEDSSWPARHEDERATELLRAGQPPSE